MTDSITPPPELVQQWINEEDCLTAGHIAARAAQWAADMELEACCQHVQKDVTEFTSHAHLCAQRKSDGLRAARRPKPPSLKEQALEVVTGLEKRCDLQCDLACIRRALEALPE
jgi:hypothetical protein